MSEQGTNGLIASIEQFVSNVKSNLAARVTSDDPRLSDAREWNAETVSQQEAETGSATTRRGWTAQRIRQAITAWWATVSDTKFNAAGGTITGDVSLTSTTASTTPTTGALKVSGGIGVAGSIYAAGNVAGYSDARLKDELEIIENALDRVMQINGFTYVRTDAEMKGVRQAGVIAQQVQAVLPEAIGEGEYLSVFDSALSGLFVEAIKELAIRLNATKGQVEELKLIVESLPRTK